MARSDVRPPARTVVTSAPLAKPRRTLFASIALAALTIAPFALAQTGHNAKKKKTSKAAASASASASAAPSATDAPADSATAEPSAAPSPDDAASKPPAPAQASDSGDTDVPADTGYDGKEDPDRHYYFVGARYRGTIVPSFIEHLFVNDGATIYSNTIGAEAEIRKDGHSMTGWIAYTEYGFGNTLFMQKGQPDEPQNYSIVSSGLKGIYLGLDEAWSVPIANHLDFEYGFGIGLGVIFGDLVNDWVTTGVAGDPGAVKGSNGNYYVPCQAQTDGPSCLISAHKGASIAKVGEYVEPSWFGGGSVPVIFPHIAIPQLALRYKPMKQLETRLSLGFSITGFWFGLSADYGLENDNHEPKSAKPAAAPSSRPAHEHHDSSDDSL